MISRQEVQYIAKLARLGLSDKELAKMRKELAAILQFVEKLKEVDVSKIKATYRLDFYSAMRNDKAKGVGSGESKRLLDLAPQTKDGYVKVKAVL